MDDTIKKFAMAVAIYFVLQTSMTVLVDYFSGGVNLTFGSTAYLVYHVSDNYSHARKK